MDIEPEVKYAPVKETPPKKVLIVPAVAAAVALLILILAAVSIHPVREDEFAIQRRFAQVVHVRDTAGMLLVVPFMDTVTALPKNYQMYDLQPSSVLTNDKKAMEVDSYCVWRISDPMKYITNLNDLDKAQSRLDATIYNATKNTLSALDQEEIFSEREGSLDSEILGICVPQMEYYGIELLAVNIKKFSLPEDNLNAVYARMISERNQIATQYRAEGQEEANKVRNTADKDAQLLVAAANANAAVIEAEGESEYMRILSEAYRGSDRAEFYTFMRSIDALKATMKGSTSIVLPYDSPLGKWFMGYE